MVNTKQNQEKIAVIVKKVAIPDTLLLIPYGGSRTYDCRTFAPIVSVRAAISRINADGDKGTFHLVTEDNGATYTVTRK